MRTHKVLPVALVDQIVRNRQQNNLRYWFALVLFDERGTGWVHAADLAETANHLACSVKTVKNNLFTLQKLGWGNYSKRGDKFFYISPVKIAQKLNINLTKLSAKIPASAVNSAVYWRAYLDAVLLGHSERTIARDTRTEQYGRNRRTQRKYERMIGVKKAFNFGLIRPYQRGDAILAVCYEEGAPVFVAKGPDGIIYFARQLPNTYLSPVTYVKRRWKATFKGAKANSRQRIYYQNMTKAEKGNGQRYGRVATIGNSHINMRLES